MSERQHSERRDSDSLLEKAREVLKPIKEFNEKIYPSCVSCLASIKNKDLREEGDRDRVGSTLSLITWKIFPEKDPTPEIDSKIGVAYIPKEVPENWFTKIDEWVKKTLKADKDLFKFAAHDVNNYLTGFQGALQLLGGAKNMEEQITAMQTIVQSWPRVYLAMEDVALRGVDAKRVPGEKLRQSDVDLIKAGIETFAQSASSDKRVQKIFSCPIDWPKLDKDEYVKGSAGTIANAVMNMVRNASEEVIGSNRVILKVERENNELVFRVIDDGRGMPPEYLDSASEKNIFREGRSHRKSSGLGLTNMPERLHSMDATLTVLSFFKQDGPNAAPAFFENWKGKKQLSWMNKAGKYLRSSRYTDLRVHEMQQVADTEKAATKKHDLLLWRKEMEEEYGFQPSTIFEIRMPITKKTKM